MKNLAFSRRPLDSPENNYLGLGCSARLLCQAACHHPLILLSILVRHTALAYHNACTLFQVISSSLECKLYAASLGLACLSLASDRVLCGYLWDAALSCSSHMTRMILQYPLHNAGVWILWCREVIRPWGSSLELKVWLWLPRLPVYTMSGCCVLPF